MHIRTRKLIGTFALLVLVTLWALLAMAVAQVALTSASGIVAGLYYVVAGASKYFKSGARIPISRV